MRSLDLRQKLADVHPKCGDAYTYGLAGHQPGRKRDCNAANLSYSHEGHEFSDHPAELRRHPQVDRGSRIFLDTGHIKRFRRSSVVHGQDRDESRPTPRRALDVCAPDRRSAWTTRAGRCHCHGRRSGYSACTYKPDWCHPAVPVHARCSGLVGVCGRHRRAGRPARRWPRGKCASEQPRTGK